MIAFVQPFGLRQQGGGARILRAMLTAAEQPFLSICTSPGEPPSVEFARELHIPIRPHMGRIEHTRFGSLAGRLRPWCSRAFRRRLAAAFDAHRTSLVHAIPHDFSFWEAFRVARERQMKYVLNVHDELDYNLRGSPDLEVAKGRLAEVWRNADARIVICPAMGEEYCRRYGEREFSVVTDGLDRVAPRPKAPEPGRMRLYFMGLFHLSYQNNLDALLRAVKLVHERSNVRLSLTFRSGSLPLRASANTATVNVLPLGSESLIEDDMANADVLYLPLPFGREFEPFVKFSLSTKLITYLGSGIPILYHGPRTAAAARMLEENDAAILLDMEDPDAIAETLVKTTETTRHRVAENALALGRRRFLLTQQRRTFWSTLNDVVGRHAAEPARDEVLRVACQ